jgi:hypothetical protein
MCFAAVWFGAFSVGVYPVPCCNSTFSASFTLASRLLIVRTYGSLTRLETIIHHASIGRENRLSAKRALSELFTDKKNEF